MVRTGYNSSKLCTAPPSSFSAIMSAFSSTGRKEDVSMKLRAQNMKNAKDTTKKLEQDNRKMEERLRELKMAMNREKEERERQGGGFWQRGQSAAGTLNNYASEVLQDKTNKAGKKKGVKVLKDEPLDLPRRNSGPGTMKYIAQRSPKTDHSQDSRNKGAKCGQCEDRQASLNCVQCSELYCAGCFAAFHLKGALKRHRSIPLHASGPRQCMSPRPTPPASSRSSVGGGGATSGDVLHQTPRSGRGGASGGSISSASPAGVVNNNLLDGAYDEADSAASFQQALMAWRQGDSTPAQPQTSVPAPNTRQQQQQRQAIVVSPVRSPVTTTSHSTSTTTLQQAPPEIKFGHSSISYAQRLMLKQHRRSELGSLSSSRVSSAVTSLSGSSGLTSVTPRLSSVGGGRREEGERESQDEDDEEDVFEDHRSVDFHAIYEAMISNSEPGGPRITVPDYFSPRDRMQAGARSDSCSVQEMTSPEAWASETNTSRTEKDKVDVSSKLRETRVTEKPPPSTTKSREVTGAEAHSRIEDRHMSSSQSSSVKQHTGVLDEEAAATMQGKGEKTALKGKPPMASSASSSAAAKAAAPQPKSRPASARVKSSRSRPTSRAASRAASRMMVEGLLTKAPSSALADIAKRAQDSTASQYASPMEGFFLAGVKVEDQVTDSKSRPRTPARGTAGSGSKSRPVTPAHMEKFRISNRLYAMSPRSWRPDSSLGGSESQSGAGADAGDGAGDLPQAPTPVMHYSYSGQLQGNAVSWNPLDSISTPVPPEEEEMEENPTPTLTPTTPTLGEQPSNTSLPASTSATSLASQQRRSRATPDPNSRPFSAQSGGQGEEKNPLRPNSSTGGAEPSKKQRRKLPTIDSDLDADQRERARLRNKGGNDGWTGDDEQKDPIIRAVSASRTRSWVASQNSLLPESSEWETEVQDFVRESSELDLEGLGEVTPRNQSRQSTMVPSSRHSAHEETQEDAGRLSRMIVMDGEDLSKYDTDQGADRVEQNTDDSEALNKLEWELASESGRLTAEGQISRLSIMEGDDGDAGSSGSRSSSSLRMSYDQGYDISSKLKEDELSDSDNEQRSRSCMGVTDEQEVRALK